MDGTGLPFQPGTPAVVARGAYRPFGAFRLLLALMVVLQHLQYLLPDALRAPFHRMGFGASLSPRPTTASMPGGPARSC